MTSRSLALAVMFLGLIIPVSARADVSGARLQGGNWDVQFMIEDLSSEQIRRLLFGTNGAVERTAHLIARHIDEALAGSSKDLTVHLRPLPGGETIEIDITSTAAELESNSPLMLGGDDAVALSGALCSTLGLSDCDVEASPDQTVQATVPSTQIDAPPPGTVLIEIGNLPTEQSVDQIILPIDQGLESAPGERLSLPSAIDDISEELYQNLEGGDLGVSNNELELAVRPAVFVVHCTAFGANDAAMRKWTTRNTQSNVRNKSHGVILKSGEWLQMWDFSDRHVWATKTETCRETKAQALGSSINIELHYFCASNRADKADDRQYKKLADLFVETNRVYGPLTIVSHKEFDRGLKDGHNDPIGFDFDKFYKILQTRDIDVEKLKKISAARHSLRTGADLSHHWRPTLQGAIVLERDRADDCMRDHR